MRSLGLIILPIQEPFRQQLGQGLHYLIINRFSDGALTTLKSTHFPGAQLSLLESSFLQRQQWKKSKYLNSFFFIAYSQIARSEPRVRYRLPAEGMAAPWPSPPVLWSQKGSLAEANLSMKELNSFLLSLRPRRKFGLDPKVWRQQETSPLQKVRRSGHVEAG